MEDDVLGSKFYVGVNAIKGLERIVNLLVREHFRLGMETGADTTCLSQQAIHWLA